MTPEFAAWLWVTAHQMADGVMLWLGVTLVVWKVARHWPGQRHRALFHRPAPSLMRYVSGELPVCETLLTGGVGGMLLLVWLDFTALVPRYPWGLLLEVIWGVLLGVALFNAGRKSGLRGLRGLMVAAVCSGLWIEVTWRGASAWWGE
ncbi:hypothetical protein [Serratia ureilytica]|uniref:hypothetical protein n=1 Tax=Serratia ureilytica TaxID=300181 RepID=UPI00313E0066